MKVALLADYVEEGWPSMDLVAAMVARHVSVRQDGVDVSVLRAPFQRRVGWLMPWRNGQEAIRDRVLCRFWDYPRWLRARIDAHDVFHVIDHSYAHLVHVLPAHRTVVTCHDIDAFRHLLPGRGRERGGLPVWLTRRVLAGLRAAAHVVCVSRATRDDLVKHELVPSERVSIVPNGVDPVFETEPDRTVTGHVARLLEPAGGVRLLHVGSTIPRKRIDRLLDIVAAVRARRPDVWLVRAGGTLTPDQRARAASLGVADRLIELPFLDPSGVAAAYRQSTLLLLPSDREGFGLPIVESLSSGTPVVASDLPVLREVGGEAIEYVPPGEIEHWAIRVTTLLEEHDRDRTAWQNRRARGRAHARQFAWPESARRLVQVYRSLSGGQRGAA